MSRLFTRDFLIEVQKGNVPGHSMVHKFGRNPAIASGSWELIGPLSTVAAFRTSASTVRIKAGGNAADDTAGAGAREVTVQGIDDAFNETSEAIATAGASASSATTASFWRVQRSWVSAVGTYGAANTGDVTIEDSGGAADMIEVTAGEGQTQYGAWTVPISKTGYLLSSHVTVDGAQPADVRCFVREDIDDTSAPMKAKRLKLQWDGIEGAFHYTPRGADLSAAAKADIWFEARGSGGVASVTIQFELLVVDD